MDMNAFTKYVFYVNTLHMKMANGNSVNGANYGVLVDADSNINENCTTKMETDLFSNTWGFNLEDLYKIALVFFKGNSYKLIDGRSITFECLCYVNFLF